MTNKWIKCSEQLPKERLKYNGYYNGNSEILTYYKYSGVDIMFVYTLLDRYVNEGMTDYTHRTELPSNPKLEE